MEKEYVTFCGSFCYRCCDQFLYFILLLLIIFIILSFIIILSF